MKDSARKHPKFLWVIVGALGLTLLMLYMTGFFVPGKIAPGTVKTPEKARPEAQATATAERTVITEFYEAVGTVRPMTEIQVEALVSAKILDIRVRPGDLVQQGDTLILLDPSAFQTRLDQARQGISGARSRSAQTSQSIAAAEAAYRQAEAHYNRIQAYLKEDAATHQDFEQAEAGYLQAKARLALSSDALAEAQAGVKQAEEAMRSAQIQLGYTRILAPEKGQISGRLAEPGDLAMPGKPLLTLQTRGTLRLEAQVREGLMQHVSLGQRLTCVMPALQRRIDTEVQEIVPAADPMTRTFVVKAGLPRDPDLFPGMYGRLLIPVKERPAVTVPKAAVRYVGQLDTVMAQIDGTWQKLLIKTGQEVGEQVEVLAGLKGGEVLALREN